MIILDFVSQRNGNAHDVIKQIDCVIQNRYSAELTASLHSLATSRELLK